jgi:hypothetical protein
MAKGLLAPAGPRLVSPAAVLVLVQGWRARKSKERYHLLNPFGFGSGGLVLGLFRGLGSNVVVLIVAINDTVACSHGRRAGLNQPWQ